MTEPPVIADERDLMQAALHLMRDTFVEACQMVPDYEAQGRFQHTFFDGYQEAKRIWGRALVLRDVASKAQGNLEGGREVESALPTVAQIEAWLVSARWHAEPPGDGATLWHPACGTPAVAIPHGDGDAFAITGAVRRIAERADMTVAEVVAEMRDINA